MTEAWAWPVMGLLILMSGMFSGLTLGLMGLDKNGLEIVMKGGSEKMKKYAKMIVPVRKNGNLLLCTLLLGNVGVNSALSILIADVSSGLLGLIISTAIIVVFGEILPQAICSRHPLAIGARAVPIVRLLIWVMIVITWPLSKMLDLLLGTEIGTIYSRSELMSLVDIQRTGGAVDADAANVMLGALQLAETEVERIMTPADAVYKLERKQKLGFEVLRQVFKSGYSRIPVYDEDIQHDNIVGVLFVKDLILLDPKDETPIDTVLKFYHHPVQKVFPDTKLNEMLNTFKEGRSHLAIVRDVNTDGPGDNFYYTVGLVTLEDVIEHIIQDDIVDETDAFVDQKQAVPNPDADEVDLNIWDTRARHGRVLTPQEASAVFYHLKGVLPLYNGKKAGGRILSDSGFKRVLAESQVMELARDDDDRRNAFDPPAQQQDAAEGGRYLYSRGKPTDYFSVVLDGELEVMAGVDGFRSKLPRWSTVCPNLLTISSMELQQNAIEAEPYSPDFSSKAIKRTRILRISRKRYLAELRAEMGLPVVPGTRAPPAGLERAYARKGAPSRKATMTKPRKGTTGGLKQRKGSGVERVTTYYKMKKKEQEDSNLDVAIEMGSMEGKSSPTGLDADAPKQSPSPIMAKVQEV